MEAQLFSISEMAIVLGVTRYTIRNHIQSLKLKPVGLTKPLKFESDAILKIRAAISWKKVEAKRKS